MTSGKSIAARGGRLLAVCGAVIHTVGAYSQESAVEAPAGVSEGLEEIVVSAQRRDERLQDVPISVTRLDTSDLVNAGVTDLPSIVRLVPDLRFDNQGPYVQATIRGVGTDTSGTGPQPNVGIYIDGFYVPNLQAADQQLLSIDNIQVLKGPQGTLFGRNTTGGAILVSTAKPSHTSSAIVDAVYGSYNTQRYSGYATTGLTDKIAVDVAGLFTKSDSYFTNILSNDSAEGGYKTWTGRLGLKFDATDNLSFLLRYEHQGVNDPTQFMQNAYVLDGQPIALEAIIPGTVVATEPGQVTLLNRPHRPAFLANNNIFQLTSNLDLGFATLTSYSQFRQEDEVWYEMVYPGSIPLAALKVPENDRTITQELLLNSNPGPKLQWTVGAFYYNFRDFGDSYLSISDAPSYNFHALGSSIQPVSYAAYADATYQFGEKLYGTLGLRYTYDDLTNGYYFTTTRTDAPGHTENHVTPRVVVRYAPDGDSSIYASYTRGYKAANYNLADESTALIRPEEMSAFEIGYKRAVRTLAFDIAAYYYDYSNLQVPINVINAQGVGVTSVSNAAHSRIYGVEANLRYELVRNLQINLGGAYLNAKYTSFPDAPGFAPCFSSAAVCGANYGMVLPISINLSGREMVRAPPYTGSLGVQYSTGAAGGRLAFSANLYATSRFFEDAGDQLPQPGYATLGLRSEWTDRTGRYTVAVSGTNVTDKKYYATAFSFNQGVVWAAPAMVFGELKVHF